jgi:uncharacterized iron-regulated membrane protein
MWIWIVLAVVAVAAGLYAFWPRKRGISDRNALGGRRTAQGTVENYNNPSGPNFSGPM